MKLSTRYKKLTFWNKVQFWGAIASILGIFYIGSIFINTTKESSDITSIVAGRDVNFIYVDTLAGLKKLKPEIDMFARTNDKDKEKWMDTATMTVTLKVKDATNQRLDKFKNLLEQTKSEKQYSFDDWYYKGAAEFRNQEYPEAINSFTNALYKVPGDEKTIASFAYNYRGAAYSRNGEPEEAFKNYEAATTLLPDSPLPHSNIGRYYYYHRKDYEKAFNNFNRASELYINENEYEWALDNIAETLSLLGNKDINEKTKLTVKQEIEQLEIRLKRLGVPTFYNNFAF